MTEMDKKRAFVSDLYKGKGWKHRVLKMGDDQVVAIYLREQSKVTEVAKPEKVEEKTNDIPF